MAYSKTNIFNLTLNILGVSAPIQNGNETTDTRAILLDNQYELARDTVLKDYDWNFAMRHKNLALTANKSPNPNYLYEFAYPNDCISARKLLDENGKEKKFLIATSENNERTILTNTNPAILKYTRLVEQETYFTPEFVMALGQFLASLTGEVITGSMDKGNNALKKYEMFIAKGKVQNATEGTDKDEDESTYVDSRY
ncbi:MAG: hypothetical protein PHV37_09030 [Candidatus Gastranaerophilales bacterium]|nr:hypothetical protein [Candidatus Gastranaerophilales bacterium]